VRGASLAGLGWLALALGAIVYPLVLPGAFYVDVGTTLLLAAATAAAWNIIGGYAGQVSVGHAMFFGAGAYLPLLVYKLWEWPPIAGLPFGIVVSLVLAVLVGMPTFRLQGHYFSMATIAVAELIRLLVATAEPLGAAIGLQGPAVGRGIWDLTFRSGLPYYYLFLALLAIVLATSWWLQRSRLGFYLRALRASERAARSLGVPVRRCKLLALMLSAAFTSAAGSLYAVKTGFVDPESGLGILVSVQMIIVAALGGAGTLFGPVLGAFILTPLQTVTNTYFGGEGSGLTYILYGGAILLIARFEPGGVLDLVHRLRGVFANRIPASEQSRHAA
jgi:branched-chain amino acid transport system permease protein